MTIKSFLRGVGLLALSGVMTLTSFAIDEEAFANAIQDCLNPYAGSCAALNSMKDKLRGLRKDGSYEYFRWEKQGTRSSLSDSNLSTKRGTYSVNYKKGATAKHIYRVGFIVPKNRGGSIDNTTFTLKSYKIRYTPVPSGRGIDEPITLEENLGNSVVLKPQESFFVDLPHVAQSLTISAKVSHPGTKRSWRSLGLNPDPNFDIKVIYATQLDDAANPDAKWLKIAKSPKRQDLANFGVPSYEIPPHKASFGYQEPFFQTDKLADEAKSLARTAASMRSAEGVTDMLYKLKRVGGSRKFNRRIDEILDYTESRSARNSNIALSYAKAMIQELANKGYYYPAPQTDLKPGYGGVEDPAGDWGDRPGGSNPSGDWDDKPSNPSGNWDDKPSNPSGNWDDKPGSSSNSAGDWGDSSSGTSGNSVKTSLGTRKYDSVRKGVAIDAKSGRVSKSSSIENQIRKDGLVIRNTRNGVRQVIWRFTPRDGKCGPTDSVKSMLIREKVGIDDSACPGSKSNRFYDDSDSGNSDAGKW